MVETMTVVGIVISAMPIGEFDKRLVLLTKEFGKITAFARGARRQNSQFMAGSQPMSFGQFTLYRGRNAYTLTGVKITDYFSNSMKEIDSMYLGMYFLEIADYYGREGIEAGETLKLLYASMKALAGDKIDNRLIRRIFEFRMLVINGEYPNIFSCGNCNSKENLDYFDRRLQSLVCANCHGTLPEKEYLDNSAVYALQFIATAQTNSLYTFALSESVLAKISDLVDYLVKKHIDKKFNSLDFIEI